jgi:hypothetical protein
LSIYIYIYIYTHNVKFLALLGAPNIYDISRLRVNICAFCDICQKSLHSVVTVSETFKIQAVKSSGYNTDYTVVLMYVLFSDGSIYICVVLVY